jgi:DNA repair exonuclease SbcCD ATPase subunit
MPETTVDVASLNREVADIETKLDENAALINNIRNGSAVTAKQNELRQLEMDLEAIKRELESESVEQGYKVQTRIQEEQSNLTIIQRKADEAKHQITILQKDVKRLYEKMNELRASWTLVNQETFNHVEQCECPTCGQNLPEDRLQDARNKALETFNLKKAEELEHINNLGVSYKSDKDNCIEKIEKLEAQLPTFNSEIQSKEKLIEKLNAELQQLRESIKDARQDPKFTAKQQEIQKVKEEIESLKSSAEEAVQDIEKEVSELRFKRTELNARIAQQAQAEASKKRIAELEEQQKELAAEFEKLEHELFLTEEFIRSKVELLEERINSKFKFARFKLFDQQINGGLQEVCETTFEGVPYSSGLNNAARINVGIDIINTLTEHFGIRAPIFVDNAEAVTRLIDTDSQLISLVVSEQDKQLRIESQSGKESEVA